MLQSTFRRLVRLTLDSWVPTASRCIAAEVDYRDDVQYWGPTHETSIDPEA
jgi:hypothetical protein